MELRHFGILGMKWGVRRYQNKDGTLTPAGKKRYAESTYRQMYTEGKKNRKYVNEGYRISEIEGQRRDAELIYKSLQADKKLENSGQKEALYRAQKDIYKELGGETYVEAMRKISKANPGSMRNWSKKDASEYNRLKKQDKKAWKAAFGMAVDRLPDDLKEAGRVFAADKAGLMGNVSDLDWFTQEDFNRFLGLY